MYLPKEPNKDGEAPRTPAGRWPGLSGSLRFKLAALVLIAVSALAGTGLARLLKQAPGLDEGKALPAAGPNARERFQRTCDGWGKPDLVFLLSAEEHGYLLPCGCSEPQVGGLERRYNLLRLLKDRGWPVVALDVGDVPQKEGIQGPVKLPNIQGMPKYVTSMKARKAMGYTAVGIGEYEASLSLFETLANWALDEKRPGILAANVKDAETLFPTQLHPWTEAVEVDAKEPGGLPVKVGVAGLIGPSVQGKIKENNVAFERDNRGVLRRVLAEMKGAGIELPVLLYQGQVNGAKPGGPATEAVACAECFPELSVILCLSEEDMPPGAPHYVENKAAGTKTAIITLGHKCKYVGVLGVWRTDNKAKPFDFKYQLVELTPDFKTPPAQRKGHPIHELMEAYTQQLKNENYLARYGQTKHELQVLPPVPNLKNPGRPNEPTYVGTAVCKKCHEDAYEVWEKTPHHEAYAKLVGPQKEGPSNRQFDAECIVCHTVGFGRQGGFTDAVKTPHLENVGCESCHGPGSLHVKNPNDPEWQKRMNLAWWKDPDKPLSAEEEKRRLGRIDDFCQKCHDHDNDVTWIHGAFARKWAKIAHPRAKPSE
jgi:hypothetical protein